MSNINKNLTYKFKKFLQNKFKNLFQILFFKIYGKIILNLSLNIKKISIENFNLNENSTSVNNLYTIPNGRVYTDFIEHVAIIYKNQIIPKISYQQINSELKEVKFNKTLIEGTPRILKKLTVTFYL